MASAQLAANSAQQEISYLRKTIEQQRKSLNDYQSKLDEKEKALVQLKQVSDITA